MNGDTDRSAGRRSRAFAAVVVRWRVAIVLGWIVLAVLSTLVFPTIKQAKSGSLGDLVANDAEAIETEVRSVELFSFPVLSRTVVVESERAGLSRSDVAEIYRRAARIGLGESPQFDPIAFALAATDGVLAGLVKGRARAALSYLFFRPEVGPLDRTRAAERLAGAARSEDIARIAGVTGAVPARGEQLRAIDDALPLFELATVLLVLVAVGFHFRSVVAPIANVITVALAYLISLRLLGASGDAVGISVPEEVEPVMVALLFGIVTDYSIFFISRFRGHLAEGVEARLAAELTTAELTPIVGAAGLSVAAASASLIVAQLGFFKAFGPGLALAVLVSVAVVMTFVPALLALLGRLVLWPNRPEEGRPEPISSRFARLRERALRFPSERPVVVILISAIPLLLLSVALLRIEVGNTLISGLPEDSGTKRAARQVQKYFPAGAISPTMVLVEAPDIALERDALARFGGDLSRRQNVAQVVGPGQVAESIDQRFDLGAVVSPTGDAARYLIVLDVNPLGARGLRTIARLDANLESMLIDAGIDDAEANLAGDTAISEETVRKTGDDLLRIVPATALLVFVILAIFLGALVAPLYLVAASLLALGASLGLTVLVFQDLLGFGELTFYVPFAGTVLLVALGSDYNIYLVGKVWAEARDRPLRRAVAVAGARATSAISVAGLVLAASFALLALVPLRPFRELAFVLSAGLLIDAFVVRTFLAPALISLVGERSGWPGKRLHRVEVAPEFTSEPEPTPPPRPLPPGDPGLATTSRNRGRIAAGAAALGAATAGAVALALRRRR